MRCAGCLTRIQPPLDALFHYRANELLVRAVDQGAMPVVLTVQVLRSLGRKSCLFVPGIEVTKGGRTCDVDILAACNGHLVLVECKDLEEGLATVVPREDRGAIAGPCRRRR